MRCMAAAVLATSASAACFGANTSKFPTLCVGWNETFTCVGSMCASSICEDYVFCATCVAYYPDAIIDPTQGLCCGSIGSDGSCLGPQSGAPNSATVPIPACEEGQFCQLGLGIPPIECASCAAGFYSANNSTSNCFDQAAAVAVYGSPCTECPDGYFSEAGATMCSTCPTGKSSVGSICQSGYQKSYVPVCSTLL